MLRRTLRALKSRPQSFVRLSNVRPLHDEYQYLHLVNDIVAHGEMVSGRNGNAKTIVGASMHFDLANGTLPLLTTKKVAWKTCLRELLWFIRGQTDNNILRDQNVSIWNGNASREFLDSRGVVDNREGDLGPVYGHQWRHFNADYTTCDADYSGMGVDQLGAVVESLEDPSRRSSRRLVVSAWNPCQIDSMALPPCHVLMQFNVLGNKLHCSLYQRSADVGLGVPFNIASYSMLTHLLAHHVGLEAGEFIHHLGNCHIYDDQPYPFPTLRFRDRRDALDLYEVDDFVIEGYESHESIKMDMRQ
jgi:thymidylate synthase